MLSSGIQAQYIKAIWYSDIVPTIFSTFDNVFMSSSLDVLVFKSTSLSCHELHYNEPPS